MFDFYKFMESQQIINLLVLFLMYHSDIQRMYDVHKYEAITAMMMAHLTQQCYHFQGDRRNRLNIKINRLPRSVWNKGGRRQTIGGSSYATATNPTNTGRPTYE